MPRNKSAVLIVVLLFFAAVLVLVSVLRKHPIMSSRTNIWSIGIYFGKSPTDLNSPPFLTNPVLTAESVTDVKADFVADPFMIRKNGQWYMFFEVMNALTRQGDIGLAVSGDLLQWEYKKIVLDEPFHLSYPYVFDSDSSTYLIPESAEAKRIAAYKPVSFPAHWEYDFTLVEGDFGDHSLFRHSGKWWLLAGASPREHRSLRLFFADDLRGPWKEHPASPVVADNARIARPGGRVPVLGDTLLRFGQDCRGNYGRSINVFRIVTLTETEYREVPFRINPVLNAQRTGWAMHGMHHADVHRLDEGSWVACVDGYTRRFMVGFDY